MNPAPSRGGSILSSRVISTPEEGSDASSTDLVPVLEVDPTESGSLVGGEEAVSAEGADISAVDEAS